MYNRSKYGLKKWGKEMRFEGLLKAGVGNTSWLCRHGPIVQKPGISGVRQRTVPRPDLLSSGAF